MVDTHKRSLIKTMSWRGLATLITVLIVYLFTRKLVLALEVGLFEVSAKLIFYYLHERIWERLNGGELITLWEGFR